MAAILAYLVIRWSDPGPFFRFKDGRGLTRARFVEAVRRALVAAGIEAQSYSGHSFRIGAATTAAAKGVPDSLIKTLPYTSGLLRSNYVLCQKLCARESEACIGWFVLMMNLSSHILKLIRRVKGEYS